MTKYKPITITIILTAITLAIIGGLIYYLSVNEQTFDGDRALRDVYYQVSLGPRIPNSQAHRRVVEWMTIELEDAGWVTGIQQANLADHNIQNIIAKLGEGAPRIILGAHYDSRLLADQDPLQENRSKPVPGANDGASGVSILLELARRLPDDLDYTIWLVFFDAEDNGNIDGWDWIMGSQAFVNELATYPESVVIVDMIGDQDLNIYYELNSDTSLSAEIWYTAAMLGYQQYFISEPKFSMLDDHTPFIEKGIPAVDIIDFDYEYWHTVSDTPDKVSAESLDVVGETLLTWLLQK